MKRLGMIIFLMLLVESGFSSALAASSHPAGGGLAAKNKESQPPLPDFTKEEEAELSEESFNGPPSSPDQLLFDLTDCVRMGLRNNSEIRASDYDIEESEYRLKEAHVIGMPVLNYQYETAPIPKDASRAIESFFSGDITTVHRLKFDIGIPVTTFGKVKIAQQLARGGISASKERKNQKSSEVVLKIKQLYYGVLLARDLGRMMEDALKKVDKEILQRESQAQPTDPVDLAKLKLTRYELLKRLGEASRKGQLAVEGLRFQMGLDRGMAFEITDRHLRPVEFELKDLDYYLQEAKRYRPESRLLDIALKAKEDEYRLEKRKLAPDVGVGFFFEMGRTTSRVTGITDTNDFNDPFNFTRAGVGLRLKGEFNWRQSTARIKQKQAQYYKMSLTKDYAEEGLDLEIRDSYLNARQSKADLENAEKAFRLSRQLVFLTKSNYDVGVGDKKDYGDALQAYLLMKGRYYEAIFNYNVAVATLISKVGYQAQF